MQAVGYFEYGGVSCARVRIMVQRVFVYVYLAKKNNELLDICLPGDLMSIKDKVSEDQRNVIAARARATVAAHELWGATLHPSAC
jgi:hypothetical protein